MALHQGTMSRHGPTETDAGAPGWVRAVIWLALPLAGLSFLLAGLSGARLASRMDWDGHRAVVPPGEAPGLPQAAPRRPVPPDAAERAWREAVQRTGRDLGLSLEHGTGVQARAALASNEEARPMPRDAGVDAASVPAGVAEATSPAAPPAAPIMPGPASGPRAEARPIQPGDRAGAQAGPAPATAYGLAAAGDAETVPMPADPRAAREAEVAPAPRQDAVASSSAAPAPSSHATGAQAGLLPAPPSDGAAPASMTDVPLPSRLEAPFHAAPDARDLPAAPLGSADANRATGGDTRPVPDARTEVAAAPAAPATPRVFIHHRLPAGATAAGALAARLRRVGIAVAAIRSVAATPPAREIRYFHSDDGSQAADLARLLGAPAWRVRDFRGYPAPPRPGTLEIWLPDRTTTAGPGGGRPG